MLWVDRLWARNTVIRFWGSCQRGKVQEGNGINFGLLVLLLRWNKLSRRCKSIYGLSTAGATHPRWQDHAGGFFFIVGESCSNECPSCLTVPSCNYLRSTQCHYLYYRVNYKQQLLSFEDVNVSDCLRDSW